MFVYHCLFCGLKLRTSHQMQTCIVCGQKTATGWLREEAVPGPPTQQPKPLTSSMDGRSGLRFAA